MRRRFWGGLLATVLTGTALTAAALVTAGPAAADTVLCDQYASTTIAGGAYIVQNNRWGTSATQCISVSSTGFRITQQDGVAATNGAPTAYPSVYWGCHYGACTPGFSPIQASSSQFAGISTSVSMSYPSGGNWDAAYDIWFDPTPRTTGQNTGAEIMVWLNHSGPPQPVGSRVATVTLAGSTWDVWEGNIGWNVISYVRTSGTGSLSFPVSTFFNDAVSRGYASPSWYLTSIQAGFEPWSAGTGLAVNSFSVTTGGVAPTPTPTATATPTPTPTPTVTPTPTATRTPTPTPTLTGGGTAGCSAAYAITQTWTGGFTANVTVTAGSTATRTWRVTWTWPSGQTVTNLWNATASSSGSTQTASSLSYNGALAPGAGTSFGFQANGTPVTPTLSCSAT